MTDVDDVLHAVQVRREARDDESEQPEIPLDGASDHGVSEALYLRDPDGNGLELAWDRPEDQWPRDADGRLTFGNRHLDLEGLLREGVAQLLRGAGIDVVATGVPVGLDRQLIERGGKLRAQELSGATFSISNLGMYDVEEFSAIINPPEGAILAVGSVLEKPVADGGQLRVGRRMKMTISCDHRVMDGAMGARFLQDVKRLLEEPLRLLV